MADSLAQLLKLMEDDPARVSVPIHGENLTFY